MHKQGVAVIVRAQGNGGEIKILAAQRRDGSGWTLPGGKVDPGERARRAAVRECEEETGVRLRLSDIHHVYSGTELEGWVTNCFIEGFIRLDCIPLTQQPGEAPCKWATWEELFEGPFGDFNRKIVELLDFL
jgi:8-oxo-dGTP diphosphatase